MAWTKGFLKSLQVVLICTVGEIFQLCICKKWICLHGMEDTSSFWVLSQTEPSSSALEESACRKHPSNSSVLDWGDCAPQGTSRSVWRHVYFTTGEGSTGFEWLDARDAATYLTVHRTVSTSKNDPALISMVPR